MAAAPTVVLPALLSSEQQSVAAVLRQIDGGPALGELYPTQDPGTVQNLVGAAHARLDEVTSVVTQRPTLAKAAWDWGFGDWESALGAASHMGRRDIAEVLIAHGARPNLFTFAMLGQVDVVRAICTANPGIQRTSGPHGITLLRHAIAGKEPAQDVVEYLTQLGGADESPVDLPLDEVAAKAYTGQYEPIGMPFTRLVISWSAKQNGLTFQRDARTPRALRHEGNHIFHPAGAPGVQIVFSVIEGTGLDLTIKDGDSTLVARRAN